MWLWVWKLLESCLLFANSLAILNDERLLVPNPNGWGYQEYWNNRNSFKGKMIGLIYAAQYIRVPLIFVSLLFIFVKMVSGVDVDDDSCSSVFPHIVQERNSELLYDAGMGLWTLLEGFLLLANALAILNEDRFLAPRGWSFQEYSGIKRNSFKGQILGLIYATQYMRVPLILLNLLCIIVKVVSG
ncbi:hypothetical protein SASPL_136628 [Salvia splendens]|uniref:Yos1-like protein n=2 Tax=Salvia TaxID=21880 RepID=A0A8X8ZGM4_SALSN|nr:hypothetical protein SASPL_136628 [Salvia splendens]